MIKIVYSLILITTIFCSIGFAENNPPVFTDNLLDAIALSESSEKDILVVFSAEWCKFCKILEKDIVQNPAAFDNLVICYVDIDNNKDLAKIYNVGKIPDYFILHNKIETKRRVGYKNKQDLVEWLHND